MIKKQGFYQIIILFLTIGILVINYLALKTPLINENGVSIFDRYAAYPKLYAGKIASLIVILFYISIITVLIPIISLVTKKKNLNYISLIYLIIFQILLIVYPFLYSAITPIVLVFSIVNLLLVVIGFVMLAKTKQLTLNQSVSNPIVMPVNERKMVFAILILNIVSIAIIILTFVIPLYTIKELTKTTNIVLINALSNNANNLTESIIFLVFLGLFIGSIMYFAASISYYISDKKEYIKKSLTLIKLTSFTTFAFFVIGLIFTMVSSNQATNSVAFIPMLFSVIIVLIYSILSGKVNANYPKVTKDRLQKTRIEPLIYIALLTLTTILLLFLNIVKISVEALSYNQKISVTGLKILTGHAELGAGYNVLAFLLLIALITSGIGLVVTLASYLSKFKQYGAVVKTVALTNFFLVFILGISGFYFSIAKEINEEMINLIFDAYGITIPPAITYDYSVSTDAIYALIFAVVILIVMIVRNALNPDYQVPLIDVRLQDDNLSDNINQGNSVTNQVEEPQVIDFDPCPAFSFLDNEAKVVLPEAVTQASLNQFITFIVDYAKNSRLHLSYTKEDIATFISGLAASKLSILQGMSGTGKTSLPKIFVEAILGRCEIIEVESSWKDKNELLGYYNEFSMKYTPKKFTLALYKAALNPEQITLIVLDEMNLSRIEYYFSDFLSLMENEEDKREIKLLNISITNTKEGNPIEYRCLKDGNTLRIPANVWFIGTANRDESTFVISDKVYDRANTINFTKRAVKVRDYSEPLMPVFYNYQLFNQLLIDAKTKGSFDGEKSELINKVEKLLAPFNISFGNRILKQIEDFVNVYQACFPDEDREDEAVETILLSKVVAKLEVKSIDNKDKLIKEFEKLSLIRCAEFIRHIDGE